MKILFLTKRQYMHKDLLDDKFGRFRELSLELAKLGHKVEGACLSYQKKTEGYAADFADEGFDVQVNWHSFNSGRFKFFGFFRYAILSLFLAKKFKPDVIYACSDSTYAILGVWLSKLVKSRCVVDLYDVFERFSSARIPCIISLFHWSMRYAAGVTSFCKLLVEKTKYEYKVKKPIMVLENGVSPNIFCPRNYDICREHLKLPKKAKIIGLAGALYQKEGIEVLFRGFNQLTNKYSNIHLAVAGPKDQFIAIPNDPKIHYFEVLSQKDVAILINALNVAVICNSNRKFADYIFPQKAYEIIACRVPLVAAKIGAMKDLLSRYPECLFESENVNSFVAAVSKQLDNPVIVDIDVPSWSDSAKCLQSFLKKVV